MDFKKQCELVKKWTEENGDYKVDSLDERERKVNLRCNSNNLDFLFTITVPGFDLENWMVWSESEIFLPYLQDIQEYLASSREKTVTDILDRVKSDCCKSLALNDEDENESDEDNFDEYYDEDDDDLLEDDVVGRNQKTTASDDDDEEAENFFGSGSNPVAVQRLLKDLKAFRKDGRKFGLDGGPRNDNLFVWDIKLVDIPESKLAEDLKTFARRHNTEPCINLEMMFPSDYPMAPPFVRVTTPRFKFLTGHVTIGGSICMEMLTKSGWMPTNDIENILVQIRCEILSDPNAQLDLNNANTAYTITEARAAFQRMVQRYGWDKS
ncbi:uncharacterized protein LOC111136146 [Crassostrea virginica]|uniref:Ubiquitin-conjugating enzyme E2 Q1-like n=1 Tax=Crassostrea virginica TaxID=6565 RepID=A0A8B8ERB7_CRAVI|nr:ubiquitin-conjugating enzyme E2 Q1-like [Crassostrea virginica]